MQNYIMLTQKYLLFYAHIISRVEAIITIFYLQFERENKLNSKILVNLLRKIFVSNKFMNLRIVFLI
jgi:hypothetical protein